MPARILTINSGSSSIKFSVFAMDGEEQPQRVGAIERIGLANSRFYARDGQGGLLVDNTCDCPGHDAALQHLLDWLHAQGASAEISAVGHRVVHGGLRFSGPERVSPEMLATLRDLFPIDPTHLPHEHAAIVAIAQHDPDLEQVACFDTAFHARMPPVARRYAIPRRWHDEGIVRFGFHGLSYEYILEELARVAGDATAAQRILIAHLGNGASMAAVRDTVGIDTTMGFSPLSGLVMGTRCGDLDPAVALYLLEQRGMSASQVNELLNRRSGLLGVSETTSDMRGLLMREARDFRAAEAIDLFCYSAAKHAGALAVALGGLDVFVFTGGIGERAAPVRARICEQLRFLGVGLDCDRNEVDADIISRPGSRVTVRVMKTNEERMIARHTYRLVCKEAV